MESWSSLVGFRGEKSKNGQWSDEASYHDRPCKTFKKIELLLKAVRSQ